MQESKRFVLVVSIVALVLVVVAVGLITRLYQGNRDLLRSATFSVSSTGSGSSETITPNADGDTDIATISYELSRNATVSIYFERGGERHYFRREKGRGIGDYSVNFSGVVEGYVLPNEVFASNVEARLLRDGTYTWVVEAVEENGESQQISGSLTIMEADAILPDMRGFQLDRVHFTPNRDGIGDRLQVQFDLAKEVEQLRVFLLMPNGTEQLIEELPRDVPTKAEGRHIFDYSAGVDQGAQPPPDGVYEIVAFAQDAEGQKMRTSAPVTIQYGGVPRAEIVSPVSADTLQLNTTAVQLCDTLHFTTTVRNYGDTPIRTTGPAPGTIYDSDWNYNTLGWHTESGAWRIAIGYENELKDYAYRWGLAPIEQLTKIDDHYYLMPDQQVVVTGGIRIIDVLGERNPQPLWVGLIHEDVEISQFNNRVDPHALTIDEPPAGETVTCDVRDVPVREVGE